MLENKILNLNLKILIFIISVKVIFILNFYFTKNFSSEIYTPNYSVFKVITKVRDKEIIKLNKKKYISEKDFHFIYNDNNKIIKKINKIESKNFMYYFKRLNKQNLDPNILYQLNLTKNPNTYIFTKNIFLENLPNVIIVKINKLIQPFEVNFFQRSKSSQPYKFDLIYNDEIYHYYMFLNDNLSMTYDTNINILFLNDDNIFPSDINFYYFDYDQLKLQQIKSILSNYSFHEEFIYLIEKFNLKKYYLNKFTLIGILFQLLFLFLIINSIIGFRKSKNEIYYIVIFSNINFFLLSISNHYIFLPSSMLALSLWMILFKTKYYNIFFVSLTIILSFFLLHFGKFDYFIFNFFINIVSIFIFHKIIKTALNSSN